jgi:hypothetical protein
MLIAHSAVRACNGRNANRAASTRSFSASLWRTCVAGAAARRPASGARCWRTCRRRTPAAAPAAATAASAARRPTTGARCWRTCRRRTATPAPAAATAAAAVAARAGYAVARRRPRLRTLTPCRVDTIACAELRLARFRAAGAASVGKCRLRTRVWQRRAGAVVARVAFRVLHRRECVRRDVAAGALDCAVAKAGQALIDLELTACITQDWATAEC